MKNTCLSSIDNALHEIYMGLNALFYNINLLEDNGHDTSNLNIRPKQLSLLKEFNQSIQSCPNCNTPYLSYCHSWKCTRCCLQKHSGTEFKWTSYFNPTA